MNFRAALMGAAALTLAASSASAQGQAQKQTVIPKTVLKSMVANKPKTKKQIGARAGIVRRSTGVAVKTAGEAPTSVRQIKPTDR